MKKKVTSLRCIGVRYCLQKKKRTDKNFQQAFENSFREIFFLLSFARRDYIKRGTILTYYNSQTHPNRYNGIMILEQKFFLHNTFYKKITKYSRQKKC